MTREQKIYCRIGQAVTIVGFYSVWIIWIVKALIG